MNEQVKSEVEMAFEGSSKPTSELTKTEYVAFLLLHAINKRLEQEVEQLKKRKEHNE